MAKYQQYAQYKDSGVEWLGEIPNSWGVTHLKFVASIVGRIGFRGYTVDDIVDEGQGAIVLSPSNVDNDQFSLEKKSYLSWAKYFESPEIMVEENDILLVKTGSTFGKSTIVREVGEPMTINPQMVLIKKSSIDSRFLSYLFNSSLIKAKIEVSNTGSGMPTMTQENINNFPIPLPATKIDIKIANFLDHETAQIDTLIDKQQTLIQLLKEKRQAVISHAVTKGLNPDAPMKDSGVEWLGEVPEHWETWKLSHAFNSIGSGTTPSTSDDNSFNGTVPWVTTGELRENVITDTLKKVSTLTMKKYSALKIHPSGSVVIAMYGATIGRVAILGVDATTNQACCVLSDSKVIFNKFLFYWLFAYRNEIVQLSSGGGQPNINQEKVASLKVAAPEMDKQIKIVNHLDDLTLKIDTLMERANKQIQLMQERRTALISAAVTGKIDVRGWVAPDVNNEKV